MQDNVVLLAVAGNRRMGLGLEGEGGMDRSPSLAIYERQGGPIRLVQAWDQDGQALNRWQRWRWSCAAAGGMRRHHAFRGDGTIYSPTLRRLGLEKPREVFGCTRHFVLHLVEEPEGGWLCVRLGETRYGLPYNLDKEKRVWPLYLRVPSASSRRSAHAQLAFAQTYKNEVMLLGQHVLHAPPPPLEWLPDALYG